MQLTDDQKKQVAKWIAEGLKLSEIQKRIDAEFGVTMTYLDVRLLVDDLKLVPQDPEPARPPEPLPASAPQEESALKPEPEPAPAPAGKVAVRVDSVARPGALVSGSVRFSDGQNAQWYLDQFGRLGVVGPHPGYKPPAGDIPDFQAELDRELQGLGM